LQRAARALRARARPAPRTALSAAASAWGPRMTGAARRRARATRADGKSQRCPHPPAPPRLPRAHPVGSSRPDPPACAPQAARPRAAPGRALPFGINLSWRKSFVESSLERVTRVVPRQAALANLSNNVAMRAALIEAGAVEARLPRPLRGRFETLSVLDTSL